MVSFFTKTFQRAFLLALALTGLVSIAYPQQFTIRRVDLNEGKITIYYDLVDTVAHNLYSINAYSSLDNYVTPLQKVTGDAGPNVKPGPNKKVTWDAPVELGIAFSGKVSVEIRGKLFVPFIRLDELNKVYKRGKDYDITWRGGRSNNIMNFEMYKGEEKISTFPNIANAGHYVLNFPQNTKPGTYHFKISDTKNRDEVVFSSEFKVKRKIPLLVKAVPILGLGAVIYLLTQSGPKDLPGPPDPGTTTK